MMQIRHERLSDIDAREALLDAAFGEGRYRKSSERLREDRLPAEGLSFIASEGRRVIGTARLWDVALGNGQSALLLGPVAVAEDCRSRGLGRELKADALDGVRGMIAPAGRLERLPDLAALVAQDVAKAPRAQRTRGHRPHAA